MLFKPQTTLIVSVLRGLRRCPAGSAWVLVTAQLIPIGAPGQQAAGWDLGGRGRCFPAGQDPAMAS